MGLHTKLMNKDFILLMQGQFVSAIGTQVSMIALVFWIKHSTGSATLMGLIQMLASLPAVLMGPVGGTFADRHSRRNIIVCSDALCGLALLSLAGVMLFMPGEKEVTLVWLSAVFVFTGMVSAFFNPAISAAVPDLLPKASIVRGNSLMQLSTELSVFIGQGLGGTLFLLLGAPIVFLSDGLSFLFSAASESFITIPQSVPKKEGRWREQFSEFREDTLRGFKYIWTRRGLRALVLVSAAMTFFSMPVIVLLPFFVEDFLKVTADWYGYLAAAYGVGSLIGYVIAGWITISGKSRCRWMLSFIVLESAGYALLGLVRDPWVAILLAFLGGTAGGFVAVNITSILQATTPSEIRGRVFGLLGTISGGLAPISMGLAGVVADLVNQNIPIIYLVCGAATTGISLPLLWNSSVRQFLAYEAEPEMPIASEESASI